MDFKDYYKTLGVDRNASADDVKKAFRKLARKHHPDVNRAEGASARMAALNEANDVLSDADRRAAYDALGAAPAAHDGNGFRPPPGWDADHAFSDAGGDDGQHSAFFEQLFGRAARARHGRDGGPFDGAPAAMRGADHHASIELDLQDAYTGANRSIVLRSARLDAGRLVHDEHTLDVRIPAGVHESQHIRLAGRGAPGSGGAPAGDLLLQVVFKPDPRWRAEGRDVMQRLPVAPWEAVLGAVTTVRTPGGDAEVKLPAAWKTGRKLRLRGKGIPGTVPGDLYLELELALPAADSAEARAAYAALALAFPTFDPRAAAPA